MEEINIYYDDDSLDAIFKINKALKELGFVIADKSIDGEDFATFKIEKL
jgi:hypothetical protein